MNNRTEKSSAWSYDGGGRCTVEDRSDDLYDDLPTYVAVEELENGYSSQAVLQSPTPHHVQSIIDANDLRNEYYSLKKSIVQRAWSMTPYKGCNRFLMCMMVSVDDDSIERWDYEALSNIVREFGPQFESNGVRLT